MDLGLKDKTALVLGGGGGLGRAISIALATEGANLAFADIEPSAIAGTEAALAETNCKSIGLVWDLSDLAQIDTHISKIESELGPVDILVNITGGPPPTPASGQDPALWSKYFQSMVLSVIAITDRVLPNMRARHWGRGDHKHYFRRCGANPQSRHLQRAAPLAGWLVKDTGA